MKIKFKEIFARLNYRITITTALLILIIFIGSLFRFTNLDGKSLWYDESLTWQESRMPFFRLINYVNMWEGGPFLFPFIIGIVSKFNDSEFFLRLLPCIFGIFSIIAIYFLSGEFMSSKAALISSSLVSLSSLQVAKSQDARYYSLVMLLSILVYLFYIKYLKNINMKYLLFFMLFSLVYLFTYYTFFINFLAFNILFLITNKNVKFSEIKRWGIVQIILLLGIFIIWNINLKFQINRYATYQPGFFSMGFPNANNFIEYWRFFLVNTWKLFNYFYADNARIAILMLFLFFVGFIKLMQNRETNKIIYLFIITVFLNIILAILGKYPYIPLRHCIYLSPFYYLIVAAGVDTIFLSRIKTKFNRVFFCIVIGLISYTGLTNIHKHLVSPGETETRELIWYLSSNTKPEERIYVYAAASYVFPYYYYGNYNICRFGRVWDNSEKESILAAYDIDYMFGDTRSGWILTMMQDRLSLTMNVLSSKWNINQIILNKKGDVKLYHVSRKN